MARMKKADRLKPLVYPNYAALSGHERDILELIGQGKPLRDIADRYGVSAQAVDQCIKDHPDLGAFKRAGLVLRMEKREWELEQAGVNVEVTRADRLLNHARWLAERSDPERWGQRQQVTIQAGGEFAEALRRAHERAVIPQPVPSSISDQSITDVSDS